MSPPTLWHRVYFLVVMGFTSWVGYFGFFKPLEIQRALPWPVPPLHCRFIGALYLSATVFLFLSMLARRMSQVHTITRLAFVWTGWLLLVSLIHWRTFDVGRVQVWFWVVAYITFPLAALWLILGKGSAMASPRGSAAQRDTIQLRWIPVFFYLVALVFLGLALLCFVFPAWITTIWPWKISSFLSQIYSGPLFGYGYAAISIARRRRWSEALFPVTGLAVFAVLAIYGSTKHLSLFTPDSMSFRLWFGGLLVLAIGSAAVLLTSFRRGSEKQ